MEVSLCTIALATECKQFLPLSVLYYFQVWVETYPTRRYGKPVKGLQDAWWILYRTLYNCTDGKNVRFFYIKVAMFRHCAVCILFSQHYLSMCKTVQVIVGCEQVAKSQISDMLCY